jgi:two-component system, NarL family, nitrate/nitrite response regulator NarL
MTDRPGRAADLPGGSLRVAVQSPDPARYDTLTALVTAAGHEVAPAEEADVGLADGSAEVPGLPTVALGGAAQESAGALPGDAPARQVDAALRAVAAGLLVRAPASPAGFAMLGDAPVLLTPRELEVLSLVGDGYSNKAAARRLGISQHTVKFHLEAVFAKLGARTRAEAVARGLRRGLVEL